MKKIALALISIVSLSFGSFGLAQTNNISIKWDNEQKKFEEGIVSGFSILKADSNFIYYKVNACKLLDIHDGLYLAKYNRKTAEYSTTDISPAKVSTKLWYLGSDTIDQKLYSFSYFHNKAHKKLYLFATIYDYKTMAISDSISKVGEVDMSAKGALLNNMFILFSNRRIMFRYECKDKKGHYYGMEIFNSKMEKEWSTYQMAETESGFNYESNYKIDNAGNVYALQRNFEQRSDIFKHYDRSRVWAVYYPRNGSTPTSTLLMLKNDYFITAAQIAINHKNQLICVGHYASPGTESAVGGFSFVLSPNLKKIESVQTMAYKPELINKGKDSKTATADLSKITAKKDFEKNFGYNFNEIHFNKDSTFDIVSEKYYQVLVSDKNNTTNYHYYDDLWVMCFNSDGSFKWVQKVAKYEYLIDFYSLLGSYFLQHDNEGNMNFIFNLANYPTAILSSKYSGKTVSIKLDKNGNESFKELITDNEESTTFVPTYAYAEQDNKIILVRSNNVKATKMFMTKHNTFIFGSLTKNK